MELDARLVTKTSEKSGKEYQCIIIKLTDDYEKTVFLESAELALLKLASPKKDEVEKMPFDFH